MMKGLLDFLKKLIQAVANWVKKCIPSYEPSLWNDGNGIQYYNNCYNYGCDIQTGTYAQPGRASGNPYSQRNCTEVGLAAQSDGLAPLDCTTNCGCSDCCHKVALVIWPNRDYHWYRQDDNGKWSHKMGPTEATNLDDNGDIITDPQTAARGNYTLFCGCYCVCKDKVTIS